MKEMLGMNFKKTLYAVIIEAGKLRLSIKIAIQKKNLND